MTLFRLLTTVQGLYALLTGVWPLVHINSFVSVTGPKTDLWLVKTVGALLIPVSLTLLYQLRSDEKRTALLLGSSTATAFLIIDFYYALNDIISNVYLVDGIVQIVFLLSWMVLVIAKKI